MSLGRATDTTVSWLQILLERNTIRFAGMERSQSDEADAKQTAVFPTDWLERGHTKHDNHIQFRDIFCLQESLHVDNANDQEYSSTTSTIRTAPGNTKLFRESTMIPKHVTRSTQCGAMRFLTWTITTMYHSVYDQECDVCQHPWHLLPSGKLHVEDVDY